MKTIVAAFTAILFVGLFLIGCPDDSGGDSDKPDKLAGKLLILQAYGNGPMDGGSPGGVSHSFVELYNTTDAAIDLTGIGLYYADGTSVDSGLVNMATEDGPWTRISLDGKTIPAGGSLLVLGKKHTNTGSTRYTIADNYGDINDTNFILSRRAFKVALIRSAETLTVQNPFNIEGKKKKASGYIDMVGAANEYSDNSNGRDRINGFEYEPARNSASEAVRRIDLKDLDDNSGDFESIRYASNGITNETLEVRKPRNSRVGQWDPFVEAAPPPPPPPGTEMLMILQANNRGNDNGGFPKSLVELYNNTNAEINLGTGDYYLHIGGTGTPGWTHAIKLTGTVPARSSYLIVTTNTSDFNPDTASQAHNPAIPALPVADQEDDFTINNTNFKIAILKNRSAVLAVANPFTDSSFSGDYVDMLGTGSATGFEAQAASSSRPQIARRKSLVDTDNNSVDFGQYDTRSANWATNAPNITKYWPRNSSAGSWNPITGESP